MQMNIDIDRLLTIEFDTEVTVKQTLQIIDPEMTPDELMDLIHDEDFEFTLDHDGVATRHQKVLTPDGRHVANVIKQSTVGGVFGSVFLGVDPLPHELHGYTFQGD